VNIITCLVLNSRKKKKSPTQSQSPPQYSIIPQYSVMPGAWNEYSPVLEINNNNNNNNNHKGKLLIPMGWKKDNPNKVFSLFNKDTTFIQIVHNTDDTIIVPFNTKIKDLEMYLEFLEEKSLFSTNSQLPTPTTPVAQYFSLLFCLLNCRAFFNHDGDRNSVQDYMESPVNGNTSSNFNIQPKKTLSTSSSTIFTSFNNNHFCCFDTLNVLQTFYDPIHHFEYFQKIFTQDNKYVPFLLKLHIFTVLKDERLFTFDWVELHETIIDVIYKTVTSGIGGIKSIENMDSQLSLVIKKTVDLSVVFNNSVTANNKQFIEQFYFIISFLVATRNFKSLEMMILRTGDINIFELIFVQFSSRSFPTQMETLCTKYYPNKNYNGMKVLIDGLVPFLFTFRELYNKSKFNRLVDDFIFFNVEMEKKYRAQLYVLFLRDTVKLDDFNQTQEMFNVLYGCKDHELLSLIKSFIDPDLYKTIDVLLFRLAKNQQVVKTLKGYPFLLARDETLELIYNSPFVNNKEGSVHSIRFILEKSKFLSLQGDGGNFITGSGIGTNFIK
jgi:hypothetical protein